MHESSLLPCERDEFYQKFKLLGNGKFNYLTIILLFSLKCALKLPFNK